MGTTKTTKMTPGSKTFTVDKLIRKRKMKGLGEGLVSELIKNQTYIFPIARIAEKI